MAHCKLTVASHVVGAELKEETRPKGPHVIAFQDYIRCWQCNLQ